MKREEEIRLLVKSSVEAFAAGFESRHVGGSNNPNGTINMKLHNTFITVLGPEIQYYSALARSLDSSLGNMLEKMAINIARLFYDVAQSVEGELYTAQTDSIAEMLEEYKSHRKRPETSDYENLAEQHAGKSFGKTHASDYYLYDPETDQHHLIELKIGGDLDIKKAKIEKEAILEQYAILCNSLGRSDNVKIHFATAYNRYGEGNYWKQERVRQFFAEEELMISKDFWNFICKSEHGYEMVMDEYRKDAESIRGALDNIKRAYLGD